ncbi:MAG: ABC transporter substrate-binding protein [Oscillibacter sp.]|nr:ABC transporter substrate-binding protein [Oscillibacter sp.]
MKNTKRLWALVLTLAMVLALAACGGSSSGSSGTAAPATSTTQPASGGESQTPAESTSDKLTVYTAFPESEVIYYFNKFTEETGIKIEYIRLSAGEMLTRVEAEKDNPQAALMFGGSTDNYIAAVDKGLLEPYQSPELSNTPASYLDPTGTWNPIYVGCIAFACNSDWFADHGYDYPASWEDLLDPKYQGEIIMAHPATSGTAYTVLATLVQLKGDEECWAYLEELNKNMSQFTKSGSAAPNAVALGEAAIALTFSHDALQLTPEGYHIVLSFPSDGTGFEVGATALIKGGPADEQANAKRFIDWMCSEAGQGCYAENDSFRVPTNTKAPVAEGLVTLDQVPVIEYDAVWAASNKTEYCNEFESRIVAKPTE